MYRDVHLSLCEGDESPVAAAVVARESWDSLCHCSADVSQMQIIIGAAFKGTAASGAASSQLLALVHRTVLPLTCCTLLYLLLCQCRFGAGTHDVCARGGDRDPICAQHGSRSTRHSSFCDCWAHLGWPGPLEAVHQGLSHSWHPRWMPLERRQRKPPSLLESLLTAVVV